jgi:hypothetical protein
MNAVKRWLFRWMSNQQKLRFLLDEGTMLGMRNKNGRTAYLYMLHNWCAEVIFRDDMPENEAEKIFVFRSVKQFNQYLEQELRKSL